VRFLYVVSEKLLYLCIRNEKAGCISALLSGKLKILFPAGLIFIKQAKLNE